MYFKKGDILTFLNPDSTENDDVHSVEILEDQTEVADDQLMYCLDIPVTQVIVVKYKGGSIGVGICTESEIDFLLPGCSPVSFDFVKSLTRDGKDVTLTSHTL